MSLLRRLSIGPRLSLLASMLLFMTFGLALVSWVQLKQVRYNVVELADNWLPSVQTLGEIGSLGNKIRHAAVQQVFSTNEEERAASRQRHRELVNAVLPAALARYTKLISSPQEQALFEALSASWKDYRSTEDAMLSRSEGGEADREAARQLAMGRSNAAFLVFCERVDAGIRLNAEGALAAREATEKTLDTGRWQLAVVVVAALLCGLGLTFIIVRSITLPLHDAVGAAQVVSEGRLSEPLGAQGRDEVTLLMRAMETMRVNLVGIVNEVRDSSDSIATGAAQIAVGNADLSQRTECQASSVQETASSLEQFTGAAQHSAAVVEEANQLAAATASCAKRGGDLVADVVQTMGKISEASHRIAAIIGTIDAIAFQTNILALNAAVEAARAGDEGRGFAVVASEVRGLAKRSSDAAKEIRTLIGDAADRVEAGTQLVHSAGGAMTEVVGSAERVASLIADISLFAEQQGRTIGEVSDAVGHIDATTQQNAALVEESAAAAESLRLQSLRLTTAVQAFSL